MGGLAGLVALCSAAGWRTAPALASREALRGLPASPLFGIAGFSGAFNAVWRSRVALGF